MKRLWIAVFLSAAACADEIPEDVSAEMEAARAVQSGDTVVTPDLTELLRTAPPGGHADWIRDIRTGLDTVPAMAAVDRGEALHAVRELYARRFEPLRLFYGADGVAHAGAGVEQAIDRAAAQLQELTRLLAEPGGDAEAVGQSVRAAQESLTAIETAARSAGLTPAAPRDAAASP